MKKLLVASLVLMGGLGVCSTAPAEITGSYHDFSGTDWAGGQICLPCHAPHNNQNAVGDLLWNHDSTTATYTLYDSPTFDITTPGQPTALSKVCLSCHDGTVALDAYSSHSTTSTTFITGSANLLEDIGTVTNSGLSNDHPVSFLYDANLVAADTLTGGGVVGLVSPTLTSVGTAPDALPLFDGMLECATCHDVHNKHNTAKDTGLLNTPNVASKLCLTCHIK